MKVIVVSSYPPRHCGIGSYAHAQVERLRGEGHQVLVISPLDGDGDVRVRFDSGRPFGEAIRLGSGVDRIVVHFQPALYYRPGAKAAVSKVLASWNLLRLVRKRPQTEIVVHEADRPVRWRPDYAMLRRVFRRGNLVFHTEAERRSLESAYGIRARARVVPHIEGVAVHAQRSREEARRQLGVGPAERLVLCAGFLHPDKGFERAVRAFARAGGDGRLVIVGSVRDATPRNLAYAAELRALCERTPGVTLIEDYVADEDFDTWLAAADCLVLPYRASWSSGALARAQRLGTPAIVSAAGGLPEQAGPADSVFETDEQLETLLRSLTASRSSARAETRK